MRILNFGSLNLDYVYQVPRFMTRGETLAATSQQVFPGGKGLNQSIALARAGGNVLHAGLIGRGGEELRRLLSQNGVDVRYLHATDSLQGNAVIQVTPQGENCILLYGGSNQAVSDEQIRATLADFGKDDWLVAQNEVCGLPVMIREAAARGMRIAFNPSPFVPELLALDYSVMSWLFINEVEGRQMTGRTEPAQIAEALRSRCPTLNVVLTLGKDGAWCYSGAAALYQPAFPVRAADTTAAGDTFTGFFLAALTEGQPLQQCLRLAAAASAISVSRAGASVSIPTRVQTDAWLAAR